MTTRWDRPKIDRFLSDEKDFQAIPENISYAGALIISLSEGRDYAKWCNEVSVNGYINENIFWLSLRDPKGPNYSFPISTLHPHAQFKAEVTHSLEKLQKLHHLAQERANNLKCESIPKIKDSSPEVTQTSVDGISWNKSDLENETKPTFKKISEILQR
jgi:hypothetical protein